MHTHDSNAAPLPNRLNEDWRFGRPHVHARELAEALESIQTNCNLGIYDCVTCCIHGNCDREDADEDI